MTGVGAQQAAREVEQPRAVGELDVVAVGSDDGLVLVLVRRDEDVGVMFLVPGANAGPNSRRAGRRRSLPGHSHRRRILSIKWIHFRGRGGLPTGAVACTAMATAPRKPRARNGARVVTRPGDTVEEAYGRLRDLIVEGVYLPGQRLPQAKLMEVLRVGRTPLRNALSRLQNDGLVIATPNHGYAVAPVPLSSAEEIYTLRLVVEPPLLEALAPGVSDAQLERMRDLLRRMEDCLDEPAAFQRAHREYHMVERATFASPFIDDLVEALDREAPVVAHAAARPPSRDP